MTDLPTEIETVTRTLTCHTDGCGNAGYAIPLEVPTETEAFTCGACNQPITDIQ